jgi:hypothetical protein
MEMTKTLERERTYVVPCKSDKHRAGTAVVIFGLMKQLCNVLADGVEVAFLTHGCEL